MTIAVVHFLADPVLGAGTANKSVALSLALARAGVRTRFITTDLGLRARPMPPLAGVDVTIIPSRFERFPVPRVTVGGMARLIEDCDAIILISHWTALNAIAWRAARRLKRPYIVCPAGALTIQGRSLRLKRLYQALVGRRLMTEAGAVLATTELERDQLQVAGVPADRIWIIPNGIETEPEGLTAAQFLARHGLQASPLLLFMGRLNPIKGPDLLIEAFSQVGARFPDWQLVLAGRDEGLEPALRARAAALGLENRIHFVGHLAPGEAVGAYRAASLLVVPSRHEAMSLVALEAGVVGTPALLTEACGFDDVQSAGGGRVVPASVEGLSDGLAQMLRNPGGLPAMGARLRTLALSEYGWPTIVRRYIDLATRLSAEAAARA